jgi:hypothetical protein
MSNPLENLSPNRRARPRRVWELESLLRWEPHAPMLYEMKRGPSAMGWPRLICLTALVACTRTNPAYQRGGASGQADAQEGVLAMDAARPATDAMPLLADAPALELDVPPPDLLPPDAAATTGLTGVYFNGAELDTMKFQRLDRNIDFAWANDPPDPVLDFSGFSVRWTGKIRPLYSETYTFTVHSSDGSRLWIDGVPVIQDWRNHAPEDYTGSIALTGNQLHDIELEYKHATGWAVVRLSWESLTQSKGVVPSTAFQPK